MLAYQGLEPRPGYAAAAQAFKVCGRHLAVDDHDARCPAGLHEPRQRDLRRIAFPAEHGFAEEHPAEPYPVEPADELPAAPRFDAVGITAPVKLDVGLHHFGRDPGAHALRAG